MQEQLKQDLTEYYEINKDKLPSCDGKFNPQKLKLLPGIIFHEMLSYYERIDEIKNGMIHVSIYRWKDINDDEINDFVPSIVYINENEYRKHLSYSGENMKNKSWLRIRYVEDYMEKLKESIINTQFNKKINKLEI